MVGNGFIAIVNCIDWFRSRKLSPADMILIFIWMGINNNGVHLILLNVFAAYSSGHALILIFMSPKLKQESINMLHQLKC
uniref:taste receptor type 2 member 123-like n=1 Tax=Podarcis muralis TaxID=64176 RepID=UPI0010A05441|nr:taste receptor type 2 member 123-like [Podarcis muralis]